MLETDEWVGEDARERQHWFLSKNRSDSGIFACKPTRSTRVSPPPRLNANQRVEQVVSIRCAQICPGRLKKSFDHPVYTFVDFVYVLQNLERPEFELFESTRLDKTCIWS